MEAIRRAGLGLWRGLRGKYAESKMFLILFGFPCAETTSQNKEILPLLNNDIVSKKRRRDFILTREFKKKKREKYVNCEKTV